jgi:galactokinase
LSDLFEHQFGRSEDVQAFAPGRINLIGEHTDYNGGFVLPMAVPLETRVRLARRPDRIVEACSASIPGSPLETFEIGRERPGRGWLDYIQGITSVLLRDGCRSSGFELLVTSDVPLGSGLSSSAALQVGLVRALRLAYGFSLSDVNVAMAAHRAETEFVGAPVGIMDQMACSLAGQRDALFLNAGTAEYVRVPLPDSAGIAVIDSAIPHHHASGQYRVRRSECEAAASLLGVRQLSELTENDLPRIASLPDPLNRRARHVVTENARVCHAVRALHDGRLAAAGDLLGQSQISMRDDFEISVPDIDCLVDIAQSRPDVYGARMTGGGFGGAVIVLGERDGIDIAGRAIAHAYTQLTTRAGRTLLEEKPWHVS